MDTTKSFSRDDEKGIREYALRKFTEFRERTRGTEMRMSKQRHDGWLVKGFDGITDMILSRSNQELPVEKHYIDELEKAIGTLQSCHDVMRMPTSDDSDPALFMGIVLLTGILLRRMFETSLGRIEGVDKDRLNEYITRLRVALPRLREKQRA